MKLPDRIVLDRWRQAATIVATLAAGPDIPAVTQVYRFWYGREVSGVAAGRVMTGMIKFTFFATHPPRYPVLLGHFVDEPMHANVLD